MADVTFVTPIAPRHTTWFTARCLPSIEAQTVPVRWLAEVDDEAKGASVLRNSLLKLVRTPFVIFLDADDWVEPTFAEETLTAWRPGTYVYTDWYEGDVIKAAPDDPWCASHQWHVITTLIPTEAAQVTGFDDALLGGEDTAFYWKLTRRTAVCPLHLRRPLFHYSNDGVRSRAFVNSPQFKHIIRYIQTFYGGDMGCCGGSREQTMSALAAPLSDGALNERQPGDVLAQAIWQGNRQVRGRVTGRLYPRAGNGKLVWVHISDAQAAPELWRISQAASPGAAGGGEALDELAHRLFGAKAPARLPRPPAGRKTRDEQVRRAQAALNREDA